MPSTKRTSRSSRSRSSRSRPAKPRFAGLQKAWKQSVRPALELRELKKWWRRRLKRRSSAPAVDPFAGVRKTFRRWMRNRPRIAFKPLAWLRPAIGEPLSTREAAALLLRSATRALLLLVLISLALNALPIRLGGPEWYLQVLAYVAENAPVLMLASAMGLLSLFVGPADAPAQAFRRRLLSTSRILSLIAALLLPVQIGLTVWLYGQAYGADRARLGAIRAASDALITGARQQNSKEDFLAYLRSRGMTGDLAAIEAAPLLQVRSEFIQQVLSNQKQQEQSLASNTRNVLLRYSVNALKLFLNLLVLATYLRGLYAFVKRSSLQRAAENPQVHD
jgi:hypothetical protein